MEQINSLMSFFCTFTYDDSMCDGYLHKKDMQNFYKSVRKKLKITHYTIGEYGTTTHRPHYHAIIFVKCDSDGCIDGLNFHDVRYFLQSNWHFGFTSISKCSYRRLNYVLHYHTRPKFVNGKPTFQLFSKGMGMSYLTNSIIDWMISTKSKCVRDFNGNNYVIPRYYRKKLVEMGYNIDGILPEITNYPIERIERVFDRKIYQISDDEIQSYLHSLLVADKRKIDKYNNQDKFV